MANDINAVTIVGRLTRDPELKTLQSGSAVANLSLAVNKTFTKGDLKKNGVVKFQSNGNKTEKVSFFEVTIWGKLAEVITQYAKKGNQICVSGSLDQQSWDAPDGTKRTKVIIVGTSVQLLGGKPKDSSSSSTGSTETYNPPPEENYDPTDDIF